MAVRATTRRQVIDRARDCCEYCRLLQTDATSPFHVDHIIPIKHNGTDELDNLCLACFQCNAFKGANVAAADPDTGEATFLFHPRKQRWDEHFQLHADATITGKTPEGRVTVQVMRINNEERVHYRQFAMQINEYPCLPTE